MTSTTTNKNLALAHRITLVLTLGAIATYSIFMLLGKIPLSFLIDAALALVVFRLMTQITDKVWVQKVAFLKKLESAESLSADGLAENAGSRGADGLAAGIMLPALVMSAASIVTLFFVSPIASGIAMIVWLGGAACVTCATYRFPGTDVDILHDHAKKEDEFFSVLGCTLYCFVPVLIMLDIGLGSVIWWTFKTVAPYVLATVIAAAALAWLGSHAFRIFAKESWAWFSIACYYVNIQISESISNVLRTFSEKNSPKPAPVQPEDPPAQAATTSENTPPANS